MGGGRKGGTKIKTEMQGGHEKEIERKTVSVGEKEKWRGASRTGQGRLSINVELHEAD